MGKLYLFYPVRVLALRTSEWRRYSTLMGGKCPRGEVSRGNVEHSNYVNVPRLRSIATSQQWQVFTSKNVARINCDHIAATLSYSENLIVEMLSPHYIYNNRRHLCTPCMRCGLKIKISTSLFDCMRPPEVPLAYLRTTVTC